jgi:hypothetical protein
MTPLTLYLAKLVGATLIVMAALLLARRASVAALAARMIADPALVMLSGALRVVAGLAIVIGHDEWSTGLAVAVTLFGWLLLLSGLLLLFASEETIMRLVEAMRLETRLGTYAGLMGVAGLLLLGEGLLGW